jgi:hypothetical protein
MNDAQVNNIEAIQRADHAAVFKGLAEPFIHSYINNSISSLVAHYRGGQLTHDLMLGKVAEISALMALMDNLHSEMRAGDAARDREFGHGTPAQQQTTPGTRSRSKST